MRSEREDDGEYVGTSAFHNLRITTESPKNSAVNSEGERSITAAGKTACIYKDLLDNHSVFKKFGPKLIQQHLVIVLRLYTGACMYAWFFCRLCNDRSLKPPEHAPTYEKDTLTPVRTRAATHARTRMKAIVTQTTLSFGGCISHKRKKAKPRPGISTTASKVKLRSPMHKPIVGEKHIGSKQSTD